MARTDWDMTSEVKPEDMNQIGEEINQNTEDINDHVNASNPHSGSASIQELNTHANDNSRHISVIPYRKADASGDDYPEGISIFSTPSGQGTGIVDGWPVNLISVVTEKQGNYRVIQRINNAGADATGEWRRTWRSDSGWTPFTKDWTTDNLSNPALQDGDYPNLRARGTTKSDVGLGNLVDETQASKTEFDDHVDDIDAHGATIGSTPGRIMRRNENGQSFVATPTVDSHVANKSYVDVEVAHAEANAIAWATSENITLIPTKHADVAGDQYPLGITAMAIIAGSDGYPINVGSVLNINPANEFRFVQMAIYNGTATSLAGDIYVRYWRSAEGWSDWVLQHNTNNLPDPARTGIVNTWDVQQIIESPDYRYWGVLRGNNQAEVSVSASGNAQLALRRGGSIIEQIAIYDVGDARLGTSPIWTNGNQGNPNNLNTSSKQVVGAINELFTTVSNGKQAIRDAIADNGGTPPSGSPSDYTFQQLANTISTVNKYQNGSETSQTTVQIRGIRFDVDVFSFFYQTSDGGGISVMFTNPYSPFVRKTNTTAADPSITPVSGGFDLTLDSPAGTSLTWEAWGGKP